VAHGDRERQRQWETYEAPSEYVADGGVPAPEQLRPRRRWGMLVGGIAAGLGLLVAVVLVAAVAEEGSSGSSDYARIDPLTKTGYQQLLADLAAGPGDHEVWLVSMDRHSASIDIPTGDQASDDWVWDGRLAKQQAGGATGDWDSFDLTTVRAQDWGSRCDDARAVLGDPKAECTVTIAVPDHDGQEDWVVVEAEGPTTGHADLYYDRDGTRTGQQVLK